MEGNAYKMEIVLTRENYRKAYKEQSDLIGELVEELKNVDLYSDGGVERVLNLAIQIRVAEGKYEAIRAIWSDNLNQ